MSRVTWIGAVLLTVIFAGAFFAPVISQNNPKEFHLESRFEPPSHAHIFGRDQNGADVFAQTLYGARVSLFVSITVVLICATLGLFIGSLAGYRGGITDQVISRVIEMLQAFPGFLLALALVAVMGPSLKNLVLALCITGWTSFARLVRGEVLHLKTREFVVGAYATGATNTRILIKHIWPNLLGLLVVQATFGLAGVVLAESGLSFLGLGVPLDTPTWGALLSNGRNYLMEAPHLSLFPGLAILTLTLSVQLIGEGFRRHLDPQG